MRTYCAALMLSALSFASVATNVTPTSHKPLRVEDVVHYDQFEMARLSPTGEYLALTAPMGDRTALVMVRLSDLTRMGAVQHGRNIHVLDFTWVGPKRIIYSVGQRFGELEAPQATGELFGVDVDGKANKLLIGFRAGKDQLQGTHLKQRAAEAIAASLVDPLREDPKYALISTYKFTGAEVGFSHVERMNVDTGARTIVALAPVPRAEFLTDHAHEVRFASGAGDDNVQKLYYRTGSGAEWQLINDEASSRRRIFPLGFSSDDSVAYLRAEENEGPDGLYSFNLADNTFTPIVRDDDSDVQDALYSPFDGAPYGAVLVDGKPRVELFDAESELGRLQRGLEAGFPGMVVHMAQASVDSRLGLLVVHSDRNPADLYLFDYEKRKAQFLFARNTWADPEQMANMQPIVFQARDGLSIHGYLTVPPGSDGKNLPLVVYPHGGPIEVQDKWGFDTVVQLLASHGYAVLQVNYRGSDGYGRAFVEAGYRQWGAAMQDDLTDATRWAMAQGVADPRRICIYGASYGAYAAVMGAIREPNLYQCAAGHVGVYDLRLIYSDGPGGGGRSIRNHFEVVLGTENLEAISPNLLAERIKIPVLLTAGRDDDIAPKEHTERMRDALIKAGKDVDAKIYPGEGHNFFVEANRIDIYNRLLAFLGRQIGAGATEAVATEPAAQ